MTEQTPTERAEALAARARAVAQQATQLATAGELSPELEAELQRLEAELAALDEEEARLDRDMAGTGTSGPGDPLPAGEPDWSMFARGMARWGESLAEGMAERLRAWAPADAVDRQPDGAGEVELTQAVDGPTPVLVAHRRGGAVRVGVGSADRVVVRARGRGVRDDLTVARDPSGTVVVTVEKARWGGPSRHLTVLVPAGSPVTTELAGGSIDVDRTGGPVDVRTGGGAVRIRGARRTVAAESGGGAIRLDDVDGELRVRTGGGAIHVTGRPRGASSLSTGGGSIAVELAPGTSVAVEADGTRTTSVIPGLDVRRSQIRGTVGTGTDGTLRISTAGGTIRLTSR